MSKALFVVVLVLVSACSKSETKPSAPVIYTVDASGKVHEHPDWPTDASRQELIDELEDGRRERNANEPIYNIPGGASVRGYEFSPDYDDTTTSNLRYLVWKKRQN